MKVAIRYYSKTGHTKKLAEAISEELGVPAYPTNTTVKEEVDILFLGSAIYATGISDSIKNYIANLDSTKVKKVVNFSSATILTSTYDQVKKLVEEKGIPMAAEEFHCKGSFGVLQKGRPNQEDVNAIKAFARKIVDNEKKH